MPSSEGGTACGVGAGGAELNVVVCALQTDKRDCRHLFMLLMLVEKVVDLVSLDVFVNFLVHADRVPFVFQQLTAISASDHQSY